MSDRNRTVRGAVKKKPKKRSKLCGTCSPSGEAAETEPGRGAVKKQEKKQPKLCETCCPSGKAIETGPGRGAVKKQEKKQPKLCETCCPSVVSTETGTGRGAVKKPAKKRPKLCETCCLSGEAVETGPGRGAVKQTEEGKIMKFKKRILSILISLCMLFTFIPMTTFASTMPFRDVQSSQWFYQGVSFAYQNSMMNGVAADEFNPQGAASRAMIVTILWRLEGEPDAEAAPFKDVEKGSWYEKAVNWASEKGVVNGFDGGIFGSANNVTREQFAVILYRYSAYKKYDVSAKGDLTKFEDQKNVSAYAAEAFSWAVGSGLISGVTDTQLDPQGSATRAQIATIFMRFCQKVANTSDKIKDITLNKSSMTLTEGTSGTLTVSVEGDSGDSTVVWSSSDNSIAEVSSSGEVTAKNPGTAAITASIGGKRAGCLLTVNPKPQVTNISLNKTSISLFKGESENLQAYVTKIGNADDTVTWSSSNTNVAAVSYGKVTAKGVGSAFITATAGSKTAACFVTVSERKIEVTNISLNKSMVTLTEGETDNLQAYVTKYGNADDTVTWSSSNTNVVTVSYGRITAKSAGNAWITARAGDKEAACYVVVNKKASVTSPVTVTYVGNKNSKIFHISTCDYVGEMSEQNKVYFSSKEDAIAKGYRICERCAKQS